MAGLQDKLNMVPFSQRTSYNQPGKPDSMSLLETKSPEGTDVEGTQVVLGSNTMWFLDRYGKGS